MIVGRAFFAGTGVYCWWALSVFGAQGNVSDFVVAAEGVFCILAATWAMD